MSGNAKQRRKARKKGKRAPPADRANSLKALSRGAKRALFGEDDWSDQHFYIYARDVGGSWQMEVEIADASDETEARVLGRLLCTTKGDLQLDPTNRYVPIQQAAGLCVFFVNDEAAKSIALDWYSNDNKMRVVAIDIDAAMALMTKLGKRLGNGVDIGHTADLQLFDLWKLQNKMVEVKPAIYPLTYLAAIGAPVWMKAGTIYTTLDAETVCSEPRTMNNLLVNFEYMKQVADMKDAERAAELLGKMDFNW